MTTITRQTAHALAWCTLCLPLTGHGLASSAESSTALPPGATVNLNAPTNTESPRLAAPSTSGEQNLANAGKPSGDFATESLAGWEERSFEGNTDYELITDSGVRVLKGHTQGAASILYREQSIDLHKTPIVEWSWKTDRTYQGIDERERSGDDFTARLYVVAQTGFLPWESLAINYIWSSSAPIDDSWANPYTNKARMVVVQSGDSLVGSWTHQRRNVFEDFKRLFNQEIDKIDGYAVMVDGDNTGSEAITLFGEIKFNNNRDPVH